MFTAFTYFHVYDTYEQECSSGHSRHAACDQIVLAVYSVCVRVCVRVCVCLCVCVLQTVCVVPFIPTDAHS